MTKKPVNLTEKKSPSSISEQQFDQLFKELETEEGRKRIGDEAYKEALAAKARGSIRPNSLTK